MSTDRQVVRHDILVGVNDEIRALGGRNDRSSFGIWQFWCECGEEHCTECLERTLQAYDELRLLGLPLVAEGHEIPRARAARAAAVSLRDDALGLRNQAEHQVRRARRLFTPRRT
jgi:hypothetical protein